MLFPSLSSIVLIAFAALSVIASPAPIPAPAPEAIPEPVPIPPELQPIIAAKNNLGGVAANDDPRFNSTLSSYSNGVVKSQIPKIYVTAASLTAGTILVSLL